VLVTWIRQYRQFSCLANKPSEILSPLTPVWRPFRKVTQPWPEMILFGQVEFTIPYAASSRAPVRASVAR